MDFFGEVMEPFRWLVSAIMLAFHDGLAALGMPAGGGWTWTLAIVGLVLVIRAALVPVFLAQVRRPRSSLPSSNCWRALPMPAPRAAASVQ